MDAGVLAAELETELDDLRLLRHPFYRRWQAGTLAPAELTAYSEQYRHFEAAFPALLRDIAAGLDDDRARHFVEANLADETGDPTHVDLFDEFVHATGGDTGAPAGPAVLGLLDAYRRLGDDSPAHALAAVVAYEVQAPAVAQSKGSGLRTSYGYRPNQTRFWDLHAELDTHHGAWALEALAAVTHDVDAIKAAARRGAEAWWRFLDEREAAAHAPDA